MSQYVCPLCCQTTFDSALALKSHIRETLNKITCTICNTRFEDFSLFHQHLNEDCEEQLCVKEEETEYYCQSCNKAFQNLDSHLSEFHPDEEIVMEDEVPEPDEIEELKSSPPPPVEETVEEEVEEEEEEEEEEEVVDKAGRCYKRKFVKIDQFWLGEEPAKEFSSETTCEICGSTFSSFKSLRLHQRVHARNLEKDLEGLEPGPDTFKCEICKKNYSKEHETVHRNSHDENGDLFNCPICNKKFHTETNLSMHIKAHNNNKKFMCSYCKRSFITYENLNEHIMTQCQSRPYACQYCGRRFTKPHEKVKHERIHTGEKPYMCDICGKKFRVSYCLTLHMRTHSNQRPYQCLHCGKRFKSHGVHKHHLRTHSDVKPYQCPYCPKTFKTSVQLAGHKNCHIMPFSCTECNRPFSSLYAVRAHMESHKKDNNMKYECHLCGARYSRSFAVKDHLKKHHNEENVELFAVEEVEVEEIDE